jgi:hypothetical protein
MEEQIPASNIPQPAPAPMPTPGAITPELLEAMKAQARQSAIQQALEERAAFEGQRRAAPAPRVVYLRRNLTVAEVILLFAVSCGIVLGVQAAWNYGSKLLPTIEIRVK